MRRRVVIGVVVLAVLVGGGAGGLYVLRREPTLPSREVAAYLGAWERFDVGAMSALVDAPPAGFADAVTSMQQDLQVTGARFRSLRLRRRAGGAVTDVAAEVDLAGLGTWSYQDALQLRKVKGKWRVEWTPASLHPALQAGQRFGRTRTWPVRAPILAADGTALVSDSEVVAVGLEPTGSRTRPPWRRRSSSSSA